LPKELRTELPSIEEIEARLAKGAIIPLEKKKNMKLKYSVSNKRKSSNVDKTVKY